MQCCKSCLRKNLPIVNLVSRIGFLLPILKSIIATVSGVVVLQTPFPTISSIVNLNIIRMVLFLFLCNKEVYNY